MLDRCSLNNLGQTVREDDGGSGTRGGPVKEHGSDQSTGSLMPHIPQRGWLRGKR